MSLRTGWMIFAVLVVAFVALVVTWIQYPVDLEAAYRSTGATAPALAGVAVETDPDFLWLRIATGVVGLACLVVAGMLLRARRNPR